MELARKKAASDVEAQVDQLELDRKRKELEAQRDALLRAADTELELLEYQQRLVYVLSCIKCKYVAQHLLYFLHDLRRMP